MVVACFSAEFLHWFSFLNFLIHVVSIVPSSRKTSHVCVAYLVKYLMMMMYQIFVFVLFLCKHVLKCTYLFWFWSTPQYPNSHPIYFWGLTICDRIWRNMLFLLAKFLCCNPLLILFNLKKLFTLLIDMWETGFGSSWCIFRETFSCIIFSFIILLSGSSCKRLCNLYSCAFDSFCSEDLQWMFVGLQWW